LSGNHDKKNALPAKPLREVAEEVKNELVAALQETDPNKLADDDRREQAREARIAKAIEQLGMEGKLPPRISKVPPKKA
jgi:hypothetical protein